MIGKAREKFDQLNCRHDKKSADEDKDLEFSLVDGFVEVIGRTDPTAIKGLDAEPAPPTPTVAAATTAPKKKRKSDSPGEHEHIYEYTWTVALQGQKEDWYWRLDPDDPVVIQLLFHTGKTRYAVSEISASLKQVPPYHKTKSQEVMDWVEMLAPVVGMAGKALQAGGLGAPGKVLSTISKIKLNSIPVDKFPWYVKSFSADTESGIEWHIPLALVQLTGNRFTGSVGITFTDCGAPPESKEADVPPILEIEVRAFLTEKGGRELFLNPINKKTALTITPV